MIYFEEFNESALPEGASYFQNVLIYCIALAPTNADFLPINTDDAWDFSLLNQEKPQVIHLYRDETQKIEIFTDCVLEINSQDKLGIAWYPTSNTKIFERLL